MILENRKRCNLAIVIIGAVPILFNKINYKLIENILED